MENELLTKKKPHREVGFSRRRRGKIQALRVAGKTIRHPDGKHCNVATYGNVYHIGAHSCVVERVTSISQWTGIQITVHQLGVDVRYALLRANGAKGCFAPQFRSLRAVSEMPESGHLPIAGAIRWLVNSSNTIERPGPELFFYRHWRTGSSITPVREFSKPSGAMKVPTIRLA